MFILMNHFDVLCLRGSLVQQALSLLTCSESGVELGAEHREGAGPPGQCLTERGNMPQLCYLAFQQGFLHSSILLRQATYLLHALWKLMALLPSTIAGRQIMKRDVLSETKV